MNLFISSAIWRYYAETIALEDLTDAFNYVDEEVLEDKSLNIDECKEAEYVCK
jgi:hypothetical protein